MIAFTNLTRQVAYYFLYSYPTTSPSLAPSAALTLLERTQLDLSKIISTNLQTISKETVAKIIMKSWPVLLIKLTSGTITPNWPGVEVVY
jgi:hypothetical protein